MVLPLAAACGGGGGRARPAIPDAPVLRAYPALAYVPAQPDAVIAVQHAGDVVTALGTVVEAGAAAFAGLVDEDRPGDGDPIDIHAAMKAEFGIDVLDGATLAEHGLVLDGSAALYVQGASATAIVPLRPDSDLPDIMVAGMGGVSQTEQVDGIAVETTAVGPARLSWASDDGWFWLHVELGRGDGGAWLRDSRAALGALAGDADLAWATSSAGARLQGGGATPPVAGFVRLDRLQAGPAGMVLAMLGKRCAGTIGQVQRLALAARLDAASPEVVALADVDDTTAVRAHLTAEPQGWAQVSATPALVAAVNVDLYAAATAASACVGPQATSLASSLGIHTGRAFVDDFNIAGFKGSLGGVVETEHDGATRALIDLIPARSMLEQKTTFGSIEGYSLNVPLVGKLAFAISPTRFMLGKGSGYDLAKLAGTPGTAPGNVAHAALRPARLTADTWTFLLTNAGVGRADARRLQDVLRSWTEIAATVDTTDTELVLALRGTRATP